MLFKSARCQYREFGIYHDGQSFARKFPALAEDLKKHDADFLLSGAFEKHAELSSALQQLPEYAAFLMMTLRSDFFFAAFSQTEANDNHPAIKRTGPKDIRKFILERIKNQYADPRDNHEFVVEAHGKIVGYVELFDRQPFKTGMQCERGVFILPEEQAHGYGKEAIIAMTDYAFKVLKVDRVFTMTDPGNIRSINNIKHNSGGICFGAEESKYAHLQGGGTLRLLFHIYPDNFYKAVRKKGHEKFLMQAAPASRNKIYNPKQKK